METKTQLSAVSALLLLAGLALPGGNAIAQDAKSIAGTYASVSSTSFGENPRGQMILGQDGHYSLILARATLPKVAANSRTKGTTEENKALVDGSIGHYGRYTVDTANKTITFNVDTSTYPNWDGATFKRPFKVSGDQLTYTSTPSSGSGAGEVVWKRVN